MDIFRVITLLFIGACLTLAEDFYTLLGVERSASTKEIRQAFKKLAIKLHPDKNTEPGAHEKFLKINRAYEVLKDEDLRKKFDTYGEEGLKEDHQRGRQYESWNFYSQEFGIYDDDPEIITLSTSDFEQAVQNTEDVWFVNYYSPHCSHCHDLAPTWREVARELEGVVRIGAVNCGDDWMLCRQQGIRSYPSLIMYPSREKYHGDRVTKALVKHALKAVGARVIELWSGNFNTEMQDPEKSHHPWLITFCGDGGDCLLVSTSQKLSAMLAGLVNVAKIDCHTQGSLCGKLGVDYGTFFYKAGQVKIGEGLVINSLHTREVALKTLEQLPDVTELSKDRFEGILGYLKKGAGSAWLVHFVEGESSDLELRKLPVMLEHMNVGRVDCSTLRTFCNSMHFHKFPTFAVFKSGGGFEIHHGRLTAHDIAAFAKDSAKTPVRALGPDDFPDTVVDSKDPWFVDFFAPWCPPCMKLLPEFRKASKNVGQVSFGTVDCTVHSALCQKYNIRSYPTTILFNQSVPHQYHGHHDANGMAEFIEDTMNPPVLRLTSENFDELLFRKNEDELWLVDYFAPWCGPCQQLAPEWRRLAKGFADHNLVKVAMVDCQAEPTLCQRQNVRSYPNVRLYPPGSYGTYHQFNGWHRDAHSLRAWAFQYLPSKVEVLQWSTFQSSVLEDTTPWIIDFYTPWCGHCQHFAPEFERVAQALEGQVKAGKVDCQEHQWLCQQAGIQAYPSVRFYLGTPRAGMQQSLNGEDIDIQSADYIIKLLKARVAELKQHSLDHDEL